MDDADDDDDDDNCDGDGEHKWEGDTLAASSAAALAAASALNFSSRACTAHHRQAVCAQSASTSHITLHLFSRLVFNASFGGLAVVAAAGSESRLCKTG